MRPVPVTIVCDGGVGDGRTWADISTQQTKDGTTQSAKNGSFVETIHDENGSFDHHDKIADGQVEDQDVAGCFQLFRPVVMRKNSYIFLIIKKKVFLNEMILITYVLKM